MSTHWEELERILTRARELPASERATFIATASGENTALRSEVESLLSASDESRDFLERPAIERLANAFAADELDLRPGRRIGAYTIVRRLGMGGAGEVWRAKDERLGRDVAIKVLLPHLSTDAEKLKRFGEEARAAGSLNHPNILTVHDVGEQDGMPFLVSECLEGRNLRERLKAGPMPLAEAIAVAQGVAQGLAAAHERGIVHRDLKPENTFLKSDGSVKLLDFGLAKLKIPATEAGDAADDGALSLVAGTAAYMAPEQARGESPDPRADLFALGVMMYEMLAGQHPFRGSSVLETLHAILTRDPPDLLSVNERVPPTLAQVVMRLLQKAPEARFQSARDLAWSIAQAAEGMRSTAASRSKAKESALRSRGRWLLVPLLAAAALAVGWWLADRSPPPMAEGELTRFAWKLPEGTSLDSPPVVAPDGRRIAFTAADDDGVRLYLHTLESLGARALAGTEGARLPFWSPDGQSLAYFSRGQLMKLSPPDGAPTVVAGAMTGRGGTWTKSGVIVFAPDIIRFGLSKVPAGGGEPEPATLRDPSRGETAHWWPVALPDGVHFLYFVRSIRDDRRGIYLGRVDEPAAYAGERLFYSEGGVSLVPRAGTDEADLIYMAGGRVESRRLRYSTLEVDAQARTLDFLPAGRVTTNPLLVSASDHVMAFAESIIPAGSRMASIAMDGTGLRTWENSEAHGWPRISPDGRLIARMHLDETFSQPDVWVEELERGTVYPALRSLDPDMGLVWSPDGRHLAFVTGHLPYRTGELSLSIVAADGTGLVRSLPCPGDFCEPTDWSADGSTLLLTVVESDNFNVWTISTDEAAKAERLLAAEYDEADARYSPNGRWIAYRSEEGGRPEIMVHSVSGPPRRMAVSGEGGAQPVWRPDGKVLYFVDLEERLRSVEVHWDGNGDPTFGLPARPDLPQVGFGHWGTQYDVSRDGSRLYFMEPTQGDAPTEIQVAINWRSLLDGDGQRE